MSSRSYRAFIPVNYLKEDFVRQKKVVEKEDIRKELEEVEKQT